MLPRPRDPRVVHGCAVGAARRIPCLRQQLAHLGLCDVEVRRVELAPQHGLQQRDGLRWPVQRQQDTGKIVVLPRVARRQRVDRAANCCYRVR